MTKTFYEDMVQKWPTPTLDIIFHQFSLHVCTRMTEFSSESQNINHFFDLKCSKRLQTHNRSVISESLTESPTIRLKENSKFQKPNISVLKMFHKIHEYSRIFVFYHMHNFIRVLYTFHPFQVFSTCFKMS